MKISLNILKVTLQLQIDSFISFTPKRLTELLFLKQIAYCPKANFWTEIKYELVPYFFALNSTTSGLENFQVRLEFSIFILTILITSKGLIELSETLTIKSELSVSAKTVEQQYLTAYFNVTIPSCRVAICCSRRIPLPIVSLTKTVVPENSGSVILIFFSFDN